MTIASALKLIEREREWRMRLAEERREEYGCDDHELQRHLACVGTLLRVKRSLLRPARKTKKKPAKKARK